MIDLSKLASRAAAALAMVMALALTGCGGGGGAVTSPTTAATAPVITTQPANQSVVVGSTASFTVAANDVASYQWQVSSDGTTFTDVAGANSASYTTPATALADSGRQHRAVAANSAGSVSSNPATLTVTASLVAPTISVQPAAQTITVGQSAQFTVAVSGSPTPALQWQLSTDGGTSFSNITGATSANLQVSNAAQANHGRQFRAVASNSAGSVNSNAAVLTLIPAMFGRFAYVPSTEDNTVSIYTVNPVTGRLRHNGYVEGLAGPSAIAVDPSGKFAYVVNRTSSSISKPTNSQTINLQKVHN